MEGHTSTVGLEIPRNMPSRRQGRVNVTHPFEEAVCALIEPDPLVSAMGFDRVIVIGTVGFGRAAAFALDALGAKETIRSGPGTGA